MPGERSIMDAILTQHSGGEDIGVYRMIFPKDYDEKKAMSEISPNLMHASSLLGTIQRMFGSNVLKTFDDEWLTRMKSKDRKGEIAAVELLTSRRAEDIGGPVD